MIVARPKVGLAAYRTVSGVDLAEVATSAPTWLWGDVPARKAFEGVFENT